MGKCPAKKIDRETRTFENESLDKDGVFNSIMCPKLKQGLLFFA